MLSMAAMARVPILKPSQRTGSMGKMGALWRNQGKSAGREPSPIIFAIQVPERVPSEMPWPHQPPT